MFDSQVHRKLWLAVAATGLLTVAGCSSQATNELATTKKAETPKAASVSTKALQPTTLVTLPKGTAISATVGQTLASNKSHVGDTFAAKLATPVQVDGKTVIPKGAKVVGRVVKVKRFAIEPMFEEDAVARMEELGHAFFVFVNAENERVSILYRRREGGFGLIEPVVGGEYTKGGPIRRSGAR